MDDGLAPASSGIKKLDDQYECEADKTPLFICPEAEAIERYGDKFGYEIYSIRADGMLKLKKEYDEGD